MPSLELLPFVICRVPALPANEEIYSAWEKLKELIKESSPEFYAQISHMAAYDECLVNEKVRFTLFKYFNRAKNRATPYGRFGAVTILSGPDSNNNGLPVRLSDEVIHEFTDWNTNHIYSSGRYQQSFNFLQTNATFYRLGPQFRYLYFNNGHFELSSVGQDDIVQNILGFCMVSKPLSEVISFLTLSEGIHRNRAISFLQQMVELQLLLTDVHPNIIGEDYFKRCRLFAQSDKKYIICTRSHLSGHLAYPSFEPVKQALLFLHHTLPEPVSPALDLFRQTFSSRFGDEDIPLAYALDPTTGISYGNAEPEKGADGLIDFLKNSTATQKEVASVLTDEISKFVLQALIDKKTVELSDFKRTGQTQTRTSLPNTFSAIVQQSGDTMVCIRAGGASANSLMGRFSLAGEEFESACRSIADAEAKANPGVVFFDIAYMGEKNVDNINRRASIYEMEFPILSYAVKSTRLTIDDLFLSVKAGELILWSKCLMKRVIPRVASAYNYTRSDLSLFRFLADLQTQNIRTSLIFDPEHFFPGLSHYPRVQFKNVILSPAKWLLPSEFKINDLPQHEVITLLKGWLSSINCREFKCGFFDQKLVFHADQDNDLIAFLNYATRKDPLYIEEHFTLSPSIVNQEGKPFNHEIIVNFHHNEELYPSLTFTPEAALYSSRRLHLPGDNWIYFHLYCHYAEADNLLINFIYPFLKKHRKNIQCWFFVRYSDPNPHLRLRIRLKIAEAGYTTTAELSSILRSSILNGIIHDFQQRMYTPETKRYGENMDLTERYFEADSELTIELISKKYSINERYLLSMELLESLLANEKFNFKEKQQFLSSVSTALSREFKVEPKGFKKINHLFKQLNDGSFKFKTSGRAMEIKLERTKKLMAAALCNPSGTRKKQLIADLFHMHVNRLFINDQRMHEMIIYNFMVLYLTKSQYKNVNYSSENLH
ncbi:MAG: thiopeptide-type bacteriocin biosynthesis protein [Mucilaginibacter sp.]